MMPFATSRFQRALSAASAFERVCEVTLTRGATSEVLIPVSGSLVQDSRRSMVWSGDLTFELEDDSPLLPLAPSDLLTPFGTIATVALGVRLSDGTAETVAYGSYVVTSTAIGREAGKQTIRLGLADIATRVAGYRFEVPVVSAAGDIASVVNAAILDRLGVSPGLGASGQTIAAMILGLDTGTDPWAEMQAIAASRGLRLRYSRAGVLTLDAPPDYLNDVPTDIAGSLSVVAAFESRPANVIVARGEAVGGATPAYGRVLDADPASPTYAGATPGSSPYGRITEFYASQLLTTDAQALASAQAILNSRVGAGASWTVTRAFDPTLDIDDLIAIPDVAAVPFLAVDSVTVDVTGTTTITGRAVTV